jgi:DNA-binding XRE family transcriptional regulator
MDINRSTISKIENGKFRKVKLNNENEKWKLENENKY